ncbi:MAG: sulfurtransferase TusA family protein [Burkholderiaceae bacterium]
MTADSESVSPPQPDDAGGASVDPPAAEVDARGLNCPLPILKAKKALSTLASGQVLKVLATDPGSVRDFNAFARQTGNALVRVDESAQTIHAQHGSLQWAFYLRRR